MDERLRQRCELLARNRETISKTLKWDYNVMYTAAAGIFTAEGVEVEAETLKECRRVLKESEGIFSDFRAHLMVPIVCRMAMSGDPAEYLRKLKAAYKAVQDGRLLGSEYRVGAAMILAERVPEHAYGEYAAKTGEVLKALNREHRILTGDEDTPFAALLAVAGGGTPAVAEEAERCYRILAGRFWDKDAVWTLAQVLALFPGDAESKCRKTIAVFDEMKDRGQKYGKGREIAMLGLMTALDEPAEVIAAQIDEADDYMREEKPFRGLAMDAKTRAMFAAQVVLDTNLPPETRADDLAVNTALQIAIMIEICVLVTVLCTTNMLSH